MVPPSILVTSTSFLETPGPHLKKLNSLGANVTAMAGPLSEEQLLEAAKAHRFDGIICGTDVFTQQALEHFSPSLRVISRYGVGVEGIDLEAAARLGIKVLHTARFNHGSVAELTIGLMIGLARKIPQQIATVKRGEWTRETGFDLSGKTLAVCGFGMVGLQVARLALALGMRVLVFNSSWSETQESQLTALRDLFSNPLVWSSGALIERSTDENDIFSKADFVSIHMDLNRRNAHFINERRLALFKQGAFLVNVSRAGIVDESAVFKSLNEGRLAGFAADVIEQSTLKERNFILSLPNVHVLPHVGGRTFDGVVRQGMAAVENLVSALELMAIE